MDKMYNPPHPGRMIAETLEYLNLSATQFARHIGVAPSSITRILKGDSPITPEMAVRISAALPGPSPETWLAMQGDYDAFNAEHNIDVSTITRLVVTTSSDQARI